MTRTNKLTNLYKIISPEIMIRLLFSGLLFFGLATSSLAQTLEKASFPKEKLLALNIVYPGNSFSQGNLFNYLTWQQDTVRNVVVITRDGNEFAGELLEETSAFVKLKTEVYGIVTIQKMNIKSMKDLGQDKIRDGVLWREHMQSTRYFWQPSGYGLKKGEAYYQNVWILFNQFSVGLTDHFLLGGGILPFFLFAGSPTPVWITPKGSIPVVKDKVNIGIGGLFATVIGDQDLNLGILYGSATFGPRDRNFTFGMGYGYSGGEWASRPVFSANFLSRVGARGYFVMENYILDIDRQYGILSIIGGRSIIGRGAGLDYGLVFPFFPDIGTFFAVPWLGITIPLGKN